MRDMDYKAQQGFRRSQVPLSVLISTAEYIAASWEQETPGCTTGDPPEKVQAVILDFMRCHGIQTIEDYENSLIKDQQTE